MQSAIASRDHDHDHDHDHDRGFTLIELLVVVVILGILIAIAIPVYLSYRRGANDKAALSDLRGAIGVLEQCQTSLGTYPASIAAGTPAGTTGTACTGQLISVSSGTSLTYFPFSATDRSSYIIAATNTGGSGKTFCFNPSRGGAVAETTIPVTAYRTACQPTP